MTVLVVPIYDARKANTNFYDLVSNVEQLKCINREIPTGSCVVVTYTVNTWGKTGLVNVSFNVKWVMVLGVPGR